MKVVFAGTPDFAARALASLLETRHEVALVLTRQDRPAGRGLESTASPVKKLALEHGIPLRQPRTLKDAEEQRAIAGVAPDVMVVAAYGLILPQAVLDIPVKGALNIHASLLPRWRGAAPIQRALLAGDQVTGISIMQMEAGLDTGPVLLAESTQIGEDDTAGTLHDRLAAMGARLIVEALDRLERGDLTPKPQDDSLATYAPKLAKTEARIDWRLPAAELHRRVRAFNPFPGCSSRVQDTEIKLWRAAPADGRGSPGEVLRADASGVVVACGQGALALTELQRPGGKRLSAGEFQRGFPVRVGGCFQN